MPSPFPGMDPYVEWNPIFQELHTQILAEAQAILQPQLRPKYVARLERHFPEPECTVAAVTENKASHSTAVLPRPTAQLTEELEPDELELRKQRRIVIYVRSKPRLPVTAIELLSPSNKDAGSVGQARYLEKRSSALHGGLHWIEIDLLRGGARPPVPTTLPGPADYLFYVAQATPTGWNHSTYAWGLREPFPLVPIPLLGSDQARLDLSACFRSAYDRIAADEDVDYATSPPPPALSADDQAWLDALLRQHRLRQCVGWAESSRPTVPSPAAWWASKTRPTLTPTSCSYWRLPTCRLKNDPTRGRTGKRDHVFASRDDLPQTPLFAKDTAVRKYPALLVALILTGCGMSANGPEDDMPPPAVVEAADDDFVRTERTLEANPNDPSALREHGNALFAQGQLREAIADYTAALAAKIDPKTYYNRGVAYTALDELDKAIADYSEAIRLDPNDASPRFNRGIVYHRRREGARAIHDLTEAMRLDPKDPIIPLNRGLVYLSVDLFDLAVADFNAVLLLQPDNVPALINRGYAHQAMGKHDLAIADLSEAIRIEPGNVLAHVNRAHCRAQQKEYDLAMKDLEEAVRLDPRDAEAYNNRGSIWGLRGDHRRAVADFSKAIDLNPNLASAYRNRAAAHHALGDAAKARDDYAASVRLEPASADQVPAAYRP